MGNPFLNCIVKKCEWCNSSEWSLDKGNYLVKFIGRGKYNEKIMCLDCLKSKIYT